MEIRQAKHIPQHEISLIAKRKTFESQYPVLSKTIFTIYQGTERTLGPLPKVFSHSDD